MDGPLHPSIYRTDLAVGSWWEASAPPPVPRRGLEGTMRADVAIIGGGYTGLACALRLAELGHDAVVLEAGDIGWGSAGRNGGIVCYGGHKLSQTDMRRRYGSAECARAERMQTDGIRWLRAFCERAGLSAYVQGTGEALWAHSRHAAAEIARGVPPEGASRRPLAPSGLSDIARFGGEFVSPSFGIDPLRLVRALADAAEEAGARVLPNSPVRAWEREGASHRLTTPDGSLVADRVVLATNGFTPDALHAAFAGRAVPVISNIGVTRPLSTEERARHPWLGDDPAADSRNLLAYFRMLPEGRLLFGMRGDAMGSPAGLARMRPRLRARLAAAFPGWAGIEITHFWRGPVCMTSRLTPAIGALAPDPSVFHAFGWHGSGINMGTLGGRLLAEVIAGADAQAIPAPWRGLPPRLPAARLRPAYVALAMGAYRVADWLR